MSGISGFTASDVGALDGWSKLYGGFTSAASRSGKKVLDKELGLSFVGLSVNSLEPGEGAGYWHTHSRIEEVYVFLAGEGEMALDDDVIRVCPGSVVRVGQEVWRTWRCIPGSRSALRWLCIRGGGYELPDLPDDGAVDRERSAPW